jgi:hypothetical protein
MLACFAPHLLPWLLALSVLALLAGHLGFGRCPRCREHREPRCKCPGGNPREPQVKRPRWKDPRE